MTGFTGLRSGLLAAAAAVLTASAAQAQRSPQYLPSGHWTFDAIRRLNAMGVAPAASDPSMTPVTLQHAAAVFASAAENARRDTLDGAAELAEAYQQLLERSVGDVAEQKFRLGVGYVGLGGEMKAPNTVHPMFDSIPRYFPDISSSAIVLDGRGPLPLDLSWSLRAGLLGDELVVPLAVAGGAVGPFNIWAGRQRVHFGVGRSGASTVGTGWHEMPEIVRTSADITGAGISTRQPFYFPGFLRFLGPDQVEMVAGRLEGEGAPYVVMGRLIGHPFHRRFTLGLNRGAIFGGNGRTITFKRLLGVLVGSYSNDDDGERSAFENQVIAGLVRYRPPVERVLPLELTFEIGADDMAGAVEEAPLIVAGFDVASVPGLEALSVTFERSFLGSGSDTNRRPWYRHFDIGTWTDRGRLYAHPAGGHGHQSLLRLGYSVPERGVLLSATGFTRERGELNLFAPVREGESWGGNLSLEVFPSARWSFRAYGSLERGDGWNSHQIHSAAAYRF